MSEHQQREWKASWRDEYLKWICGFANAEGGVLEVGRNDAGMPVGLVDAVRLLEEIPNKVRDVLGIMVDVNLRQEEGKALLEIVVPAYPSPASYKGEYHYRSGSTKQELKGAALTRFLLRKQGLHWDGVPLPGLSLDDCQPAALEGFRSRAAKSGRVDTAVLEDGDYALLASLQLDEGQYLKRATALLFGTKPERFIPGASIKIGFFLTDDDLRYQDEIRGNLFFQVEKTLELMHSKYLKAYISYEGIQRVERYLFPLQALREALLNAVIHKDYASGIPIQISVYENRVVIWNPGQLPNHWTQQQLLAKHPSHPFNPLLASAFFRAGYVESWGRGIEKILSECRKHNIPPPLFDTGLSGLMLTFCAESGQLAEALGGNVLPHSVQTPAEIPSATQETTQEATQEATQETISGSVSEKVVALLRRHPAITRRELAKQLGLSEDGTKYHLDKLRAAAMIRHVGPTKSGRWEVLK
ncbi:ATP-binding protein [Pseudomonas sp. MH10]|uniref:ATP-binding protein n=1 Tax=Pseudomonas sp. MH10 TaxID=3048627 RepID=UPI002AC9D125|nr:ATP-binding protein [Pseudomonas sp. MH10]MEB0042856.1 ATP-binding protein [Pseudomonas sp. MH10]WPX62460.1 ATP-binding protein [Pseudomonas sp. MH10]